MKAVVGLGNPGEEYAETRHNIGWRVLEAMAEGWGENQWRAKFNAELLKHGQTVLVKPTTYMNHSGQAVQQVARFYKLEPDQLLIINDDVDLPFGEIKYRASGGSAGQRGLANVLEILGTHDVPRLRIGIGRPTDDRPVTDYVLSQFTPDELEQLPDLIAQAVDQVKERLDE